MSDKYDAYYKNISNLQISSRQLKKSDNTQFIQSDKNKSGLEHYLAAIQISKIFTKKDDKDLNDDPENHPSFDMDDIFKVKVEITEDRINLILSEIGLRERIAKRNLESLYKDLMQVNIWRMGRMKPFVYEHDKFWIEHNKMELNLRDKIRTELKDFAKDCQFSFKDLRESLLEHKIELHKLRMMDTKDLEDMIGHADQKEIQTTYQIEQTEQSKEKEKHTNKEDL